MDTEEFDVEWERACLSWSKDPDAKLMVKLHHRWAKGFARDSARDFRQAIERLMGEQPKHFPTFGQVRASMRQMHQAFTSVPEQRRRWVEENAAITPEGLHALADELEEEVEERPCSSRALVQYQLEVVEYLRACAVARASNTREPKRPSVERLLKLYGAGLEEPGREPGEEG